MLVKRSICFLYSFLIVNTNATRYNLNNFILLKTQQRLGSNDQTDTFLRKTSKLLSAIMQHIPWSEPTKALSDPQTIITWFQGYAGGIKVWVVQRGLMVLQCCIWTSVFQFVWKVLTMFSAITNSFQTCILLVQAIFNLQNIDFSSSAKHKDFLATFKKSI